MIKNGIVTRGELNQIWKHIETTNREMGEVQKKVEKIDTNVKWLMKFFWIIAASSLGALATQLAHYVL